MTKEDKLLNKLIENEEKLKKFREKHEIIKNQCFDEDLLMPFIIAFFSVLAAVGIGFFFVFLGGAQEAFLFGPFIVVTTGISLLVADEEIFAYSIMLSPFIIFIEIIAILLNLTDILKIKLYEHKNKNTII